MSGEMPSDDESLQIAIQKREKQRKEAKKREMEKRRKLRESLPPLDPNVGLKEAMERRKEHDRNRPQRG